MKVNIELDNLEMLRVIGDGSLEALMRSIEDENKIEIEPNDNLNRIPYTKDYVEKKEVSQVPTQTSVPVSEKSYTLDELGKAAMSLMDQGRQQDLVNLLAQFNVPALPQLPIDRYSEFALKLRELGAQI